MTGHIFLGLMRLEALKKTRLHDSIYSADIVLLAELVMLGEFHEVAEPLFYRRVHSESGWNKHTPVGVVAFEDPTKRGKILLPHWRLAFELARSLASARISISDKLRCFPDIVLWYWRFWKNLARDLLVAGKLAMHSAPLEYR